MDVDVVFGGLRTVTENLASTGLDAFLIILCRLLFVRRTTDPNLLLLVQFVEKARLRVRPGFGLCVFPPEDVAFDCGKHALPFTMLPRFLTFVAAKPPQAVRRRSRSVKTGTVTI